MEIFAVIQDNINYSVSNLGNVKNNKTGRILKPRDNGRGYHNVSICQDGKKVNMTIHRLVAEAFIPNPLNKSSVDHIDNNRTNNNVLNLRWVTQSENSMNSKLSSSNTSGYKGVSFRKKDQKWFAEIRYNGKYHFLGSFFTKEEAIAVRKAKANELFGEFTNKIEKIKSELQELEEEFERLLKE